MATLLTLPPELIPLISAHLPRPSLALFSLTSKYLNNLVTPSLYSHFLLAYPLPNVEETSQEERYEELERRKCVRDGLAALAASPERCRMVRTLEVWNYQRWLNEEETRSLEKIVCQAGGLQEARLLQDDDGAPFDPLLTPLDHLGPIWSALSLLPSLRRLRTQYGPNVVLKLDSFPSLVNVDLAMYYVDRNKDGSLPDGLQKLRLEYVCGFEGQRMEDESAWFKPSLFGSLMSFVLVDMTTATCAYVEGAVKIYAASGATSPLTHLSISLTGAPSIGIEASEVGDTLASLLSAFALLKSVQYLSITSSPECNLDTACEPGELLYNISDGFGAQLRGLVLHVGHFGDELRTLGHRELFSHFLAGLSTFKLLEQFQTNMLFDPRPPPPPGRLPVCYGTLLVAPPPPNTGAVDPRPIILATRAEYLRVLPTGLQRLEVGGLRKTARKGMEAMWEEDEDEVERSGVVVETNDEGEVEEGEA